MALRELEDIRLALDREFLPLEPMITGLRLIEKRTSDADADALETDLRVRLPSEFRHIVMRFDFRQFSLGPVAFGSAGEYFEWLRDTNDPHSFHCWWGSGERPACRLLIGFSDSHAIVLNTEDREVLAFRHGEPWETASRVAEDFELFLRGLGTMMLERHAGNANRRLAERVADCVGATTGRSFWLELAD